MPGFLDRSIGADILACLGFFTRLPLSATSGERPFPAALWAAPVAGAAIGVLVGLVMLAGLGLGLPGGAAAVLALAAGIAVTGALHEDGAADVADGFGGGKSAEDKLSIMRDSRIGTYGVLVLGLSLIGRWSALVALALAGSWTILFAAIAAHGASRALLPAFAANTPSARGDGLSAGLGEIDKNVVLLALVLGLVTLLPLGAGFAVVSLVVLGAVFYSLRWLCRRQIDGQTGDVLGALQQAAEAALLIVAATITV